MVLSSQQQMLIDRQASSKAKSIPLAYLIWVLTGAIGGHRFYLGKISSGLVMLLLFTVGLITLSAGVGAVILAVVWFWTLVDAVLIPDMVQQQTTDSGWQFVGSHLDATKWWHADRVRYLQQNELSRE
jgi:TM2 domain-containing membrane protein YozV